jgi:electron transfer flavoprotein beta subunit
VKIGVCIKEVADTASKIEVRGDGLGIQESGLKFVMNPYDEFALEEALRLKDLDPQNEVIVFSIGPERCAETIRKALAMGADRAVHLKEESLPFGEGFLIARLLQQLTVTEKLDLLLLGRQAVDDDGYQVAPMLAELGGLSQAVNVVEFQVAGSKVTATREVEGGAKEMIELQTPCLIAMSKGIHEPRYASLKGIMAAKKKEIKTVGVTDLGVDITSLRSFQLVGFSLPAERQAVKMIAGTPQQVAEELVKRLREEAKVI